MSGCTTLGRVKSYNPITLKESCTYELPEENILGRPPYKHILKVWITDGIHRTKVLQGSIIPEGWRLGIPDRDSEYIEKQRQSHLGFKWFTNGIKNLYIKEEPPEGFYPGMTRKLRDICQI